MAGWMGVDLDGTLAYYDGLKGPEYIGDPIPAMVDRVKKWLNEGREVRIFTARVSCTDLVKKDDTRDDAKVAAVARKQIEAWCLMHIGVRLQVTAVKDFGMIELWDDRCVQVQPNAGVPVHEFWRRSV